MNEAKTTLSELALLFFRLGATGFGGPAAHIAMMREEVVKRRRWLTEEQFLDLLAACNVIPGPTSTELAIHIGWERRRGVGLVVAGVSFIVPAMLITLALAWAYVAYQSVPATAWLLYGVKPVVLVVVAQAVFGLLPAAAKTTRLRFLGVAAAAAMLAGLQEPLVLLFAGALAAVVARRPRGHASHVVPVLTFGAAGTAATSMTLPSLFVAFLKIGGLLFGSGYVLLAFLRGELVHRLGWLSEQQLLDAVAIGQVTPGPLFTTATFIGYVLAGTSGALVATAGIFVPAFIFVAASGAVVPRLRRSPTASAVLDGMNVASLALMAVVTAQLGRAAIVDVPTLGLAVVAAVLALGFGVRSSWLVPGGAVAGWLLHRAGISAG